MAKGQTHLNLEGLINTLRYVTALVQLMPFIYALLYVASLFADLFVTDATAKLLDTLFYASPITVIATLRLSRLLKMCFWHKTACVIPLFPQVVSFVDYYIVELPISLVVAHIIVLGLMTSLLLFSAYKTFIK